MQQRRFMCTTKSLSKQISTYFFRTCSLRHLIARKRKMEYGQNVDLQRSNGVPICFDHRRGSTSDVQERAIMLVMCHNVESTTNIGLVEGRARGQIQIMIHFGTF